jgi:lipoprotein-anchoring transpeptidase ErfK/SrfK
VKRLIMLLALLACACSDQAERKQSATDAPAAQASADPLSAALARINTAALAAPVTKAEAADQSKVPPSPFAIRAQILLARARFSPGVVDGQFGSNFKHAIAAYQGARAIPVTGSIDSRTWAALQADPGSGRAAVQGYTITPADLAGPFAANSGADLVTLAALAGGPQFNSVIEALAERFHMSQALLVELNPGVNFASAGARLIVADAAPPAFGKDEVKRVDIAKADASARAYDAQDKLVAFYPATVGSSERPSPSGVRKVVGVARSPDYTYDPRKLSWGPRSAGKLVIKPGPNNPVGTAWIDLNAPGYGLHGTPDPDTIGKTASHGCVRLTNWDAGALAAGIAPGATVRFIGHRSGKAG